MTRYEQLMRLTENCYDDFCYYNQFKADKRSEFVKEHVADISDVEFVLPYLPLYLTTCCTLKCAKCNNLMPMFRGKNLHFDIRRTIDSLEKILGVVKEIIFCELVGGEPFLYPDFEKILDYVGNQNKIRQIVVVTNATIIPEDAIVEKLAKYKVLVRVSDYGLFEHMTKFILRLDKAGVNVRVQQNMKWNDPGGIEFRGKNNAELRRQYNSCEFSLKCKYLCEDKLFTCARIASLYHLGITDANGDVMDLSHEFTMKDLFEFYLHEIGEGCQYCDFGTSKGKQISAAEQIGNKFEHSKYTVISNYELDHFKSNSKKYEKMIGWRQ